VKKITNTSITNIAGGVLAIWILIALVQTVANNYKLEKQIETLHQQISVLQAQKDELGYNIAYYNTDSFKQRQARLRLGLEQPGENVIILPTPSPTASPANDAAAAKAKRSNLRQWLDFLTGKG
jgi:cell division protein FtsB